LDDMGVSKLSAKVFFFLKVNYSFNALTVGSVTKHLVKSLEMIVF